MSNMVFSSSCRRFTICSVLGDAVEILFAHPKTFFGLAFVAWLPGTILVFIIPDMIIHFSKIWISPVDLIVPPLTEGAFSFAPDALINFSKKLTSPLNFILTLLIQGAASFAVLRALQGRVTGVRAALSEGVMNRFAPLFALTLFIGMINLPVPVLRGSIKLAMLTFDIFNYLYAYGDLGDSKGSSLLFLVMLLSAFIKCIFYLAVPACVLERSGPSESLRRSADLTLGYRLRIFGLILILSIVSSYFLKLISIQLDAAFFRFPLFKNLVALIAMIVPQAFLCVLPPVVYYRLLELKEGMKPAPAAGANTAP